MLLIVKKIMSETIVLRIAAISVTTQAETKN